ncbi:MAG: TetR/AcrR family transcriptional regulator [Myxococcales bacterium]|nr:TetR/AcrR family transcriptional regulator [Myxococcales bacterium]
MPPPRTRTQQERRDGTRRALLDAAVESLIEVGFARTTTLEVQRRASVSRGALLHHFPSKALLLTAAIDHLAEMRGRELKARAASLPADGQRVDAVLDLLWECFGGALFQVAVELRAWARTDDELRVALVSAERGLRERIVQQARALFGPGLGDQPGFERAIDLTLQLMIGLAMTAMLHGSDPPSAEFSAPRIAELLTDWKRLFPTVVAAGDGRGPSATVSVCPLHPQVHP